MTVVINGPRIEVDGHPDGVLWSGLSDNHGSNAPCIIIPVDTLDGMLDKEIADAVRMMVDTAWFARAIQYADYFLNHAGDNKGWQIRVIGTAEDDPEGERLIYRYEDRDDTVKAAANMLRECREYARERAAQSVKKTVVRRDAQSRYADLFVKVGRRDGFVCAQCGYTGPDLQIDHKRPVSKGGTNDIGNLQLLCPPCNLEKSDRLEV